VEFSIRPSNENARPASLRSCAILSLPSDPRFDAVARLAARFYNGQAVFVSLIDGACVVQIVNPAAMSQAMKTPRDIAFCALTSLDSARAFIGELSAAMSVRQAEDRPRLRQRGIMNGGIACHLHHSRTV
jgi:hypothetical protein